MVENVSYILLNVIAVFPLWFVERLLPWPFIVEELFKALLVVLWARKLDRRPNLYWLMGAGFAFGLSENFFYWLNLGLIQNPVSLLWRLLIVTPVHVLTYIILGFGYTSRGYKWWLAVMVAIATHWGFNYLFAGLL